MGKKLSKPYHLETLLPNVFAELGIKTEIQIITADVANNDSIRNTLKPNSTKERQWSERIIYGCKELVYHIVRNQDAIKSELLWDTLLRIAEANCNKWTSFSSLLKGKCMYFYYSWHPSWNENNTHFLESVMFDNPNYLEENAFSTGHQNVNVYGLPEKCYEIRSEDNAVDIQVHKAVKQADMNSVNANGMDAVPEFEPSIEAVPEKLRDNAVSVILSGALDGKGILAPYSGKLKDHTLKPVEGMLIPVKRGGKQKVLPASVCVEDHIVYIALPSYKSYEAELSAMEKIEIRKPQ